MAEDQSIAIDIHPKEELKPSLDNTTEDKISEKGKEELDPVIEKVDEDDKSSEQPAVEEHNEELERLVQDDNIQQSVVETAKPGDIFTKENITSQPLNLSWSFGFNPSLPVHNISYGDKKMMFYICNHTGILYDCVNHKQNLLQGHGSPITCTTVSSDKRWLVTADVGKTPFVIIWDSFSAVPVRTFFEGLGQGTIDVALSHDAKYLATVSIGIPQVVSIWDWTHDSELPLYTTSISTEQGLQTSITFNSIDSSLLVSNSDDQVIFYEWNSKGLHFHSTPLTDRDFNKPIGFLSQSVFLPGSKHYALTGTSEGCVVIWETTGLHQDDVVFSNIQLKDKKAIKLMKIHDSPITTITTDNDCIVTGDTAGHIKFYDTGLKLMNWYDTLEYGPVASISFAHTVKSNISVTNQKYPSQSTLEAEPFVVPDFIVSTTTSSIIHVITNGTIVDVILTDHDTDVHGLATHPTEPRVIIGSYTGKLKLWNYIDKQVMLTRIFPDQCYIQCVQFNPDGQFVGVGFTNGEVRVLSSLSLEDETETFHYAKDCITHLIFSHDSMYMATADLDRTVTVFIYTPSTNGQKTWKFLARHRAHYKHIQALVFGVSADTGLPRLLSLGKDMNLIEYDMINSSEDDLQLLSVDRIEQSSIPTAITWYPPLSKESFLLTANDQYKLKLYNSTTKMCRKTLLGPTFGSPVRRLLVLPNPVLYSESGEEKRRYLVYITDDKVGILLLPHDGNPHNTMCLTAHPGQVTELVVSYDGQYVFTAGGEDCTVNMWTVNTLSLEASALLGGEDLEPFYSLIEGGREGTFFSELEEFFYYAQMKSQGINSMDTRKVAVTIPINQIPFVMRAIGFYPSEQEIDNIMNEVKFSHYVDNGTYVTHIDLGDFIKLYINHRPVFGLSPTQFGRAFKSLGKRELESKQWMIERSHLLRLLQEKGEHLTEGELVECLMTLLGSSVSPELEGEYNDTPEQVLQELPKYITAKDFAEEILGLST